MFKGGVTDYNQIYRTLLQLKDAGWVVSEVQQPEI